MRFGENCEQQRDAVREARLGLRRSLENLSRLAKEAARGVAAIEEVYGSLGDVRRAEESLDLAQLDLATARGEDA